MRSCRRSLFVLFALLPLAACGDVAAPGTGRLTILLTDDPAPIEKAVVTISQIYLQGAEGEDGPPGGRVVLREEDVTVDLLTLANSTAELVTDAVVPTGRYSELRFVITGGYIEVRDGEGSTSIYASSPSYQGLPAGAAIAGALQMPSFAQTGIKVTLPDGEIAISGGQKVLLVDFDVSQSFGHPAGRSGMWVMHPVVLATDFSASGSIAATVKKEEGVDVSLAEFTAALFDANETRTAIALTDPDGDGAFGADFRYLLPGEYTLTLEAPSSVSFSTDVPLPMAINVPSGGEVSRAILVKPGS